MATSERESAESGSDSPTLTAFRKFVDSRAAPGPAIVAMLDRWGREEKVRAEGLAAMALLFGRAGSPRDVYEHDWITFAGQELYTCLWAPGFGRASGLRTAARFLRWAHRDGIGDRLETAFMLWFLERSRRSDLSLRPLRVKLPPRLHEDDEDDELVRRYLASHEAEALAAAWHDPAEHRPDSLVGQIAISLANHLATATGVFPLEWQRLDPERWIDELDAQQPRPLSGDARAKTLVIAAKLFSRLARYSADPTPLVQVAQVARHLADLAWGDTSPVHA